MNSYSKIGRDFLLSSFFLLAVIAGLLNTNLFRQDIIAYQDGHGVIYPTELVLDSGPKVLSAVFFFDDDIENSYAIQKFTVTRWHFVGGWLSMSRVPAEKATAGVSFQSGTSFCYSSLFNIPHQNLDEDEGLIFSATVA